MVDVRLVDCKRCTSLPCLGQLPSLKHLFIEGMDGAKKVGTEFYGVSDSADKCFPSLEFLCFMCISEWEHWEDWGSSSSATESLIFPSLHELTIEDCPKLIKNLPTYLPDLTMLLVKDCPKLEFPAALRLPSLKEVDVKKCDGTVLRSGIAVTSLTQLRIQKISGIPKLREESVQSLGGLQALTIWKCGEITCLWDDDDDESDGFGSKNLPCDIENIRQGHDQLVSLGLEYNLRSLQILGCDKLERFPNGWHKSLTCLRVLDVSYCPKLVSLPEVGFPPNLRLLYLSNCKGLMCLPDGMMLKKTRNNLCLLESLCIYECPSLICFPKRELPTTLETLIINHCMNLKSLPEGMMMMGPWHCNTSICALEDLYIVGCPSLANFPGGSLPTTLKQLLIEDCVNLRSLPEGIMQQQQQQQPSTSNTTTFNGGGALLQVLKISNCPSLTSFPRGKFPSTLETLDIRNCEQLEPFSEEMFHNSSSSTTNNYHISLQSLSITDCPNLKTLPDCLSHVLSNISITDCKNLELRPRQFQNSTRLTSLKISHCENIIAPLSQWGLTRLPSLKSLSIGGMFPISDDDHDHHPHLITPLLPTTLIALSISEFKDLKSLASLSLQTLTSLAKLDISDCPELRSIFPTQGLLPDTLSQLRIKGCPLLGQRFSKEEGDDWPKIAHIPFVDVHEIEDFSISDSEQ